MRQTRQKKEKYHYQQSQPHNVQFMRKITFFILLFLGSYQKVFSQNIEQQVLELLYNEIKKQSEYCLIKEKMIGTYLIADPISGENEIKYSANIDTKVKADFEKFSKEEQIKILSCNNYPIFLKGTLIIVDTIGFFSEGNIYFNQRETVVIVRKHPKQTSSNCMILFAVGTRHNNLIVTLNNKNENKQLYNYYFDLSNSNIKLQKSSIIDNKVSLE
jgi:hypothetical protein